MRGLMSLATTPAGKPKLRRVARRAWRGTGSVNGDKIPKPYACGAALGGMLMFPSGYMFGHIRPYLAKRFTASRDFHL